MLRIPTEASHTKIKRNLCSYFIIKMILKHCWVQSLNCTSLLANPLPGDGVMMRVSYQNLKLQAGNTSRRANARLLILEWFCRSLLLQVPTIPLPSILPPLQDTSLHNHRKSSNGCTSKLAGAKGCTCPCWYGCAYSATPEIQCCWILRSPGASYRNPCACGWLCPTQVTRAAACSRGTCSPMHSSPAPSLASPRLQLIPIKTYQRSFQTEKRDSRVDTEDRSLPRALVLDHHPKPSSLALIPRSGRCYHEEGTLVNS